MVSRRHATARGLTLRSSDNSVVHRGVGPATDGERVETPRLHAGFHRLQQVVKFAFEPSSQFHNEDPIRYSPFLRSFDRSRAARESLALRRLPETRRNENEISTETCVVD